MPAVSPFHRFNTGPDAVGLYDPSAERDACGLAMVATLRGTAGHDIIEMALSCLRNLEHRGAVGSDAGTGDGAVSSFDGHGDSTERAGVTLLGLIPAGSVCV